MSLQEKTLNRYRHSFPEDSLRDISTRTGIQITRIYRLFSGKTMKVEELEIFENIIESKINKNKELSRINNIMSEAYASLTDDELSKISEYVLRKIKIKSYHRFYINNYQNAVIA